MEHIRFKCSITSISHRSAIQLTTFNLIQKFYLKQCWYVSFWTVILKLIEVLIYLIFICKNDSNILSLDLTSQPIVTMSEKLLEIKQWHLSFKVKRGQWTHSHARGEFFHWFHQTDDSGGGTVQWFRNTGTSTHLTNSRNWATFTF